MKLTRFDKATGRITSSIKISATLSAGRPTDEEVIGWPPDDGKRYRVDQEKLRQLRAAGHEESPAFVVDDGAPPATRNYRAARLDAYPPIGDQLDAIFQGGAAFEAMRERVMAVKAKYPKPE